MFEISLEVEKDNKIWDMFKDKENKLLLLGHIGTHIDVYKKTKISNDYSMTNGIIIDCSNYDFNDEIGIECIRNKNINEKDFVIFRTGIQEKKCYGSEEYFKNHHKLSWELIDFLISKNISFIGIDCAGIRTGKEHYEADCLCEEKGVYVIENLDSHKLALLGDKPIKVFTVWIYNPYLTGLPTRVFIY